MSNTLSIRLPQDLAQWVEQKSRATGRSQASLIKEALERLRGDDVKPFMKHAGTIKGPRNLSQRKGFNRS